MTFRRIAFVVALSLGLSAHAARPTPEALLKKSFGGTFAALLKGYAEIRMVVTSPIGVKTDRTLSFRSMRTKDNLLRYLLRFESPADIKGTAFLVREQKGAFPQQFVYLPATKIVTQVAAGRATGSFFDSDFIYADLWPIADDQKNDVEIKDLGDKDVDGQKCYVVSVNIKRKDSPYSRIEADILQDKEVATQINFFGPDGKPLKTMKVRKWGTVENKPVPFDLEMKSERGSKTEVYVLKVDEKKQFKEDDYFRQSVLPNL